MIILGLEWGGGGGGQVSSCDSHMTNMHATYHGEFSFADDAVYALIQDIILCNLQDTIGCLLCILQVPEDLCFVYNIKLNASGELSIRSPDQGPCPSLAAHYGRHTSAPCPVQLEAHTGPHQSNEPWSGYGR